MRYRSICRQEPDLNRPEETIVALATPPGEGALAVLRISGSLALTCLERLTRSCSDTTIFRPRYLHHLILSDKNGKQLDESMAVWMPAPRSFTGEDVVEIYTHGGMVTVQGILRECFSMGIKQAHPGEFTYRAFLSGRLDLTQAEAINDLIHSESERSRDLALEHLKGGVGERVSDIRKGIISLLADLEAGIDFVEEDIEFISRHEVTTQVSDLLKGVRDLLAGARAGKLIREGVAVVLAGEPNVGKSSIFNRLLDEERAIVTTTPGTTRDLIRESWSHGGVVFHLQDTAGLHHSRDEVELHGIERSVVAVIEAEIVVWILDGGRPPSANELKRSAGIDPERNVVVLNKFDLDGFSSEPVRYGLNGGIKPLLVSAKTGEGVESLKDELFQLAVGGSEEGFARREIAVNRRQEARLLAVESSLAHLEQELDDGVETELVASRFRGALGELEMVTGDGIGNVILEEIFSNFCVGK
jgi:tRNA modification GTPase